MLVLKLQTVNHIMPGWQYKVTDLEKVNIRNYVSISVKSQYKTFTSISLKQSALDWLF